MQIGVVFPQTEIGDDPALLRDYAQAAEALGYSHILAYDHVLGADPNREGGWRGVYDSGSSFHEPLALFAYLAGVTSTIGFATGVIILPQRQTALVAKQAAEVDLLSGGRLRLGIGIGWNALEYQALNEDFTTRGRRVSEQIALMRALWTNEVVNFEGRWHRVDRAGIRPLPLQRPIPVWMGGMSEVAMKRIARIGDGWIANARSLDEMETLIGKMREYERAAGRSGFGIETRINYDSGNAEDWQAAIDLFRARDLDYVTINTMGANLPGPRDHLAAIRRFKESVR